MLRLARLACLIGALAFAGPTFAQTIATATPNHVAVGATLEITGSGFGVKKPKVQLFDSATNKKYTLKVVDSTDSVIHATISKGVVGNLTLQVIVKGVPTLEAPMPISIERPLVTSLSAASAKPDAPVTIFGDFFGNKKGKIKVGNATATIISWFNEEIQIRMPKKLFNGFHTILVDNKVGVDDDATVQMVESPIKIGKASMNLAINGTPLKLKFTPGFAGAGQLGVFGFSATNPSKNIVLIIPFNAGTDPIGSPITNGITLSMTYIETGKVSGFQLPPSAIWAANGAGVGTPHVVINAASGGQVQGTVDSILPLFSNSFNTSKAASVHLTGTFILDV